jgi:uncharacterized protein (UPF0335 family)
LERILFIFSDKKKIFEDKKGKGFGILLLSDILFMKNKAFLDGRFLIMKKLYFGETNQ